MSQRQQLRQTIRTQRQQLSVSQQLSASEALVSQFIEHPTIHHASHIGLYLANDGELDPMLAIEWCWRQGKQVYLPVLHPYAKGHLLFLHFTQKTLLVPNRFGIPEPRLMQQSIMPLAQLDIVMTPLVAFDATGNRLGMGGGFYDRTLSGLQKMKAPPYVMGLAHEMQKVSRLPSQSWDVPVAEILTPDHRYIW